ncbi:glutaminase domain-containing protein [Haoranjiania flava]|uniref:DUF4965 domain-containing protein n=1 Tax=Haoranjiania flava TaxID=1856322 RepID=A0AAE3IPJ7_9BACT|nr:glutaminase family protein [Haoranjiania flava]MCU7694156.1 DUF4965 domain-containing protein [Haoranjiania flava]
MTNLFKQKRFFLFFLYVLSTVGLYAQTQKAPAYPLIMHDPYVSIWSFTDELNASATKHWTGTDQSLTGYAKIDGKIYRFMGSELKTFDKVIPTTEEGTYASLYTEKKPTGNWTDLNYHPQGWKSGKGNYGDKAYKANTSWTSDNLWVRREFSLSDNNIKGLHLKIDYDDNIEVYLNGTKVHAHQGWVDKYIYIPIKDASSILKKGRNVLAVHIKNTAGGQHLDFGLVKEKENALLANIANAVQKNLSLKATQTEYNFICGPVNLTVTFSSPLIINDLDLLARPVSYITFHTKSNDGKAHKVEILFNASSNLAVNTPSQEVTANKYATKNLSVLKAGTVEQPVLQKKGDDLRIDWGYLHVAAPANVSTSQFIATSENDVLSIFTKAKKTDALSKQNGRQLSLATVLNLGNAKSATEKILIGYDDIWSIQYFGENLRPWWNKDNKTTIETQLEAANTDYAATMKKCNDLDARIYNDAFKAGGLKYARLCEMVYRQVMAAHKLVESPQGQLLWLSKENFSNGCINTVDLTYPSAPLYLVYNPELVKGMMNGIFYYSESGKWAKPFAAHDIGTYPIANGQVYGEDMPVEESGNMVILAAAIAKVEGNAKYAEKHWHTLTTWTDYLVKEGFDPANQLCTDDFAGHMARNANLSLKAIMAIEGYAMLAKMLGKNEVYNKYHNIAKSMVPEWMKLADDGDHYTLAFEKKGTWSQKYNMVWDRVLDFNIFPKSVAEKEMKFYLQHQNKFGLPLDSRRTYTKSDWIIWTACLTGDLNHFKALTDPVYVFATQTPDRKPFGDWHETTDGRKEGFQARSVLGAYWMKVLDLKLNR